MTCALREELDYRKLYEAYFSKERKSVTDPQDRRSLPISCEFHVASRKREGTGSFYPSWFRTGRCVEAVEDLFYQHIRLLEQQGEWEAIDYLCQH